MDDGGRRRRGRMERQVRRDLRGLGALDSGVRGSLGEAALILARAIDGYGAQLGGAATPSQLSAMAKAIQELRTTLGQLTKGGDGDDDDAREQEAARMSTPVWDAEESGAADVGAADRGGGASAG